MYFPLHTRKASSYILMGMEIATEKNDFALEVNRWERSHLPPA